jgi:hypothetical protein
MKKLLLILLVLGSQMAGAQWSILKARQYPYASTVGYVPVSYDSSGFAILFHLKVSDIAGGGGGSGFANPMTTKGDMIVEDATPAPARLAGPTSATKNFLTSTGTGSAANIPAWGTIAVGDVPTLNQNTTGSAGSVSGTNVITNANLSQMAASTLKGNNTAGTANAADLTTAQVKTLLAISESDVASLTTDLSNKQAITTAATGLTAAGTNQSTALALSGNNSTQEVTTAASGTGVKLPTASATSVVTIINRGANSITVYPATSGVINGQSANLGYTLPSNSSAVFIGKDGTSWYTENAFTGGDVNTTDGSAVLSIGAGKVTLAMQANLAANSIIGNNTGSAATPIALTAAQVKTLLSLNNVENTALSTWAGSTNLTTFANNAVSYAEMQDVSATQTIIGRNTAGAGDPEEVTASQVLDWFSATQGAILYRGASGWAALAPGTSGQLLQSGGAAANPSWTTASGTGDMILASVQTVTGAKTFNAGTLLLAAGTTSAGPIGFTAGTLKTTAAQGNMEVDASGVLMYTPKSGGTAATAERGYMPSAQLLTNSSVVTLTVQTGAQSVFASTMDAVQLSANTTYRFHAVYFGTQTSSATAHAIRTAFSYSGTLGGTFKYLSIGNVSAIASNTSGQIVYVNTTAATNVTNSTASVTNFQIILDGELRTSTAGLFTPQIGMSVTTGITTFQIDTESYFEIWPVGSDTVTVVGTGQ